MARPVIVEKLSNGQVQEMIKVVSEKLIELQKESQARADAIVARFGLRANVEIKVGSPDMEDKPE